MSHFTVHALASFALNHGITPSGAKCLPSVFDRVRRVGGLTEPQAVHQMLHNARLGDYVAGCVAVLVAQEPPAPLGADLPTYDPETDGDYSRWLVSNNID